MNFLIVELITHSLSVIILHRTDSVLCSFIFFAVRRSITQNLTTKSRQGIPFVIRQWFFYKTRQLLVNGRSRLIWVSFNLFFISLSWTFIVYKIVLSCEFFVQLIENAHDVFTWKIDTLFFQSVNLCLYWYILYCWGLNTVRILYFNWNRNYPIFHFPLHVDRTNFRQQFRAYLVETDFYSWFNLGLIKNIWNITRTLVIRKSFIISPEHGFTLVRENLHTRYQYTYTFALPLLKYRKTL